MEEGHYKPGDRCDRYTIVRLLGAGGMGEVYEATHAFTGRPVALKCLQLRHASKADILERMRHEAIFLSKVRHPNMVAVHDADITPEGIVWIAMDLLEGKTLREVMHAAGPLPVHVALYFAAEIADGLQAAHELDVVHRDVKPENVFVTTAHEVKVLDLGAAKFHGWGLKTTDRMRTLGTPAYMSPEHLQGHKVDGRADLYALGLVLYEMIAGRHPFAPSKKDGLPGAQELANLQICGTPRPLTEAAPGCPAYVEAIVSKSLAKDREARYASMGALSGALRSATRRLAEERGEPPSALDPTLSARRAYAPPQSVPPTPPPPHDTERRVVAAVPAEASVAARGGAMASAVTEAIATRPAGAAPGAQAVASAAPAEPQATTAKGTLIQRNGGAREGVVVTANGTQVQLERPSPAPAAPPDAASTLRRRTPRTEKLPTAEVASLPPPREDEPARPALPLRAALGVGAAIGLVAAIVVATMKLSGAGRGAPAEAASARTSSIEAPASATATSGAARAGEASAPAATDAASATAPAAAAPSTTPSATPQNPSAATAAPTPPKRATTGLPSSGL
jgi:serine/threonine-protein kinase